MWAGVGELVSRVTGYKPYDSVTGKSKNSPHPTPQEAQACVCGEICWIIWLSCLWNCEWIQMVCHIVAFGFWWTWTQRPPENECSTLWNCMSARLNQYTVCVLLHFAKLFYMYWIFYWVAYFSLCKQQVIIILEVTESWFLEAVRIYPQTGSI